METETADTKQRRTKRSTSSSMCHHTETEHLDVGREEGAEHRTSTCEGSYFERVFIEMWLTSVAHGSVVGGG